MGFIRQDVFVGIGKSAISDKLKLLPILVLSLVGCGGNYEPAVDRTETEPIALLSV